MACAFAVTSVSPNAAAAPAVPRRDIDPVSVQAWCIAHLHAVLAVAAAGAAEQAHCLRPAVLLEGLSVAVVQCALQASDAFLDGPVAAALESLVGHASEVSGRGQRGLKGWHGLRRAQGLGGMACGSACLVVACLAAVLPGSHRGTTSTSRPCDATCLALTVSPLALPLHVSPGQQPAAAGIRAAVPCGQGGCMRSPPGSDAGQWQPAGMHVAGSRAPGWRRRRGC